MSARCSSPYSAVSRRSAVSHEDESRNRDTYPGYKPIPNFRPHPDIIYSSSIYYGSDDEVLVNVKSNHEETQDHHVIIISDSSSRPPSPIPVPITPPAVQTPPPLLSPIREPLAIDLLKIRLLQKLKAVKAAKAKSKSRHISLKRQAKAEVARQKVLQRTALRLKRRIRRVSSKKNNSR
ncbi:hypothetical protein CPB84DRAFT_1844983 [Gymnopilus junonius]|uniref:Uncharacterized protein n=1 Tax=Gymnopilus junonius TaxID=109634 RepID=A0A9P5NV61_GYMJU|nr:hypothetical protein CPB84DRAFT_1844983 [Gymnopilus junonius]